MPSFHLVSVIYINSKLTSSLYFLSPPAEILLGGVYIWGNPQLCFPDPQNITWRDTLDEQNIHARQLRLQAQAPNCEKITEIFSIRVS